MTRKTMARASSGLPVVVDQRWSAAIAAIHLDRAPDRPELVRMQDHREVGAYENRRTLAAG